MLTAQALCAAQKAFYIADIPPSSIVSNPSAIESWFANSGLAAHDYAAIYYPRLNVPDALHQNAPREIGYSGAVAGIYASTDNARGVWKAPAGTSAVLPGATPVFPIDDTTNGRLNSLAINSIRRFPTYGTVVWGARTTAGANTSDSEFQYVNVRRLAIFLEQMHLRRHSMGRLRTQRPGPLGLHPSGCHIVPHQPMATGRLAG